MLQESTTEQVARDLGVSAYSVSRWKQPYSPASAAASAPGVSVAELERRIRSLERENADLRLVEDDPTKSRRQLLKNPQR